MRPTEVACMENRLERPFHSMRLGNPGVRSSAEKVPGGLRGAGPPS